MKKILLMVLCLFLMAAPDQAGAGGKSTKQEENPRQAGKSSVYFYDIDATDTHGFGQLVINVDKHTFVFIGQAFTPLAHIELRARAVNSTDYILFASGKTTPSGNLGGRRPSCRGCHLLHARLCIRAGK